MKALKELRTYFILLLIGTLIWFTYQMITYPILPTKYLVIVLLALYFISILLGLSQYKGNKFIKIMGKLGILLLSAALIFVNFTYLKTVNLFDEIVQTEDTDIISVVVKDKSGYRYIEDLEGKIFAKLENSDDFVNETVTEISKTYKEEMNIQKYTSVADLVNDLVSGKVDAIIVNESYRSLFEEISGDFTENTRVIYSKEYKTIIEEKPDEKPVVSDKENTSGGNSSNQVQETIKITYNEKINVTEDTFSVYVSGIDTYGSISTKARSDVNMIVTINPKERKILLTSIPRDYYIPFSALGGAKDKLTHSGLYGVNETKRNVQNYFGVHIPFYVRVNFTSLVTIVDALGGITINNPHEGVFDIPTGEVTIDGKMALVYARERYSFKGGDNERIKNQMRVITGIINKVLSPEIITNYADLLDAVGGSFQTNISDSQILSLVRMQLDDMRGWTIETNSVTGSGTMAYSPVYGQTLWMMIPNYNSVVQARNKISAMYK